MKADKKNDKGHENDIVRQLAQKYVKMGFGKHIIDGFTYFFPPLVNRPSCLSFDSQEGCIYCGNRTFRYYSKTAGKKYYQCEKCGGLNH